jgi:hypothetical protein
MTGAYAGRGVFSSRAGRGYRVPLVNFATPSKSGKRPLRPWDFRTRIEQQPEYWNGNSLVEPVISLVKPVDRVRVRKMAARKAFASGGPSQSRDCRGKPDGGQGDGGSRSWGGPAFAPMWRSDAPTPCSRAAREYRRRREASAPAPASLACGSGIPLRESRQANGKRGPLQTDKLQISKYVPVPSAAPAITSTT